MTETMVKAGGDAASAAAAERRYCDFAIKIQDGVNLRAMVAAWVKELDLARGAGIFGDALNQHPATYCVLSKFASLGNWYLDDDDKCFGRVSKILEEAVEFIPKQVAAGHPAPGWKCEPADLPGNGEDVDEHGERLPLRQRPWE